MEHAPSSPEQGIRDRLAAIDHELFELKEGITQVAGKYEGSASMDDNASESELVQQELDAKKAKIEELERERDELHERLKVFQEAA